MVHLIPNSGKLRRFSQPQLEVLERRNAILTKLLWTIQSKPSLANAKNKQNELPIAFVWRLFHHKFNNEEPSFYTNAMRMQLNAAWRVIEVLLQAAYYGYVLKDNEIANFRVLHAAAGVDCPIELVRFILENYPEKAYDRDEHGRFALDIAAAANNGNSVEKINLILEANPAAASIEDSNNCTKSKKRRRFPLHEAVSRGNKSWEDGAALKNLIRAAPQALSSKDAVTGLYAYQVAASSGSSVKELNVTFELLRSTPSLIVPSVTCKRRRYT